jgi:hypothetical protein
VRGEETVVRVRSTDPGTDQYGDPLPATEDRLDIPGCLVAPAVSREPTERGRAGVVIGWTIYAPAGTEVKFDDQLEVRGVLCDVEGEVGDYSTAAPGGVVITARRATG